ncbi:hypothetical protein ACIP39_21030 [Streptomyces tibetensis]
MPATRSGTGAVPVASALTVTLSVASAVTGAVPVASAVAVPATSAGA